MRIFDGAPPYLKELNASEILSLFQSCEERAAKVSSSYTRASKMAKSQGVLLSGHERLELVKHRSMSISNALSCLQLHFERLCAEQAVLVDADLVKPDRLGEYDGSELHRTLNAACDANSSYLALDVLSFSFLCNDVFRDASFLLFAAISEVSANLDTESNIIFTSLVKAIQEAKPEIIFSKSLLADLLWLDANVTLPCQLVAQTSWLVSISGYHTSLLLPGIKRNKYSSQKFEILYRRCWPDTDNYYYAARQLAENYADINSYNKRDKALKAISLFGFAQASSLEVTGKLLSFLIEVFDIGLHNM